MTSERIAAMVAHHMGRIEDDAQRQNALELAMAVAEEAESEALAQFTALRAKGVVDADDNMDCWDTAPFELCYDHVAALNEKDPAALWRVVDLFARDDGPNV